VLQTTKYLIWLLVVAVVVELKEAAVVEQEVLEKLQLL
jgi:hypothetical protein